jgi:hypothetical protein
MFMDIPRPVIDAGNFRIDSRIVRDRSGSEEIGRISYFQAVRRVEVGSFSRNGKNPGIAGNFSGRVLRRLPTLDFRIDKGADREPSVQ